MKKQKQKENLKPNVLVWQNFGHRHQTLYLAVFFIFAVAFAWWYAGSYYHAWWKLNSGFFNLGQGFD